MTLRRIPFPPLRLAAGVTSLVVAFLSLVLVTPGGGSNPAWVRASYDLTYLLSPDRAAELVDAPVALVYLDLESYLREHQDPAKPWDRTLHAALVRRLRDAGARAIVFDIVFGGPGPDAAADLAFADALRAHGRTILAAELNDWSRQTGTTAGIATLGAALPYEPLRAAASAWGLASLRVDDDFTVRRLFSGHPSTGHESLSHAALRVAGISNAPPSVSEPPAWLRYYGPPLSIPQVGYSSALRPDEVPDAFFRDRLVFVGARPIITGFQDRRDEYRNPFSSRAGKDVFMPAVEIHATQALNLIRDEQLHRLPPLVETLALLLSTAVLGWVMFRFRPLPAAGAALAAEAILLVLTQTAFRVGHLWFPWLVVAAFQVPALFVGAGVYHSADWVRHRRRLEAARRDAEEKIREQAALLDKAQDAIWVQDLDGRILYANPAAHALYGWDVGSASDRDRLRDLASAAPEAHREARRRALAEGEWLGELEQGTPRGGPVLVQSRWTLIRDASGRPRSILSINTDVTERKRLEAQFLRAQRMQTVGTLAGGMAHDLNNALSPVLLGSQLLRRDESDPERLRLLELIELNARRGADMVRQVLLFARGTGGDRTLLDLRPLLRDMERIARQTFPQHIRVSLLAPDDLWPVRANSTELHQVLLNLCVNARDAMPEGGELSLAADNVALSPQEAAEIPQGRPGDHVMLLVADTGRGIAPEIVAHVFEPFFSTKPAGQGTGLGLATVARIAHAHGGFVALRSEPNAGTSIEVYLPRAASEDRPDPDHPPAAEAVPFGNGRLVLVADDEQALRDILESALREHGFRVVTAADTDETLEILRGSPDTFHAALIDIALPAREGRRHPRSIASEFPHLPVLWMAQEDAAQPTQASTIRKPFDVEALVRALSATLSSPTRETGS